MSDHLRRYRAIHAALLPGYSGQLSGTLARHVTTLAALIRGSVGSQSTQWLKIAARLPDGTPPESRVTHNALGHQRRPLPPALRGLLKGVGEL